MNACAAPEPIGLIRSLALVPFRGLCMWPWIREGDLLLVEPLPGELRALLGRIAIATSVVGPVAHRIRRIAGPVGRERVILGGDLGADDPPRSRTDLLGVVRAIYRPAVGFLDPAPAHHVGPLAAALLGRLGRWVQAARDRQAALAS